MIKLSEKEMQLIMKIRVVFIAFYTIIFRKLYNDKYSYIYQHEVDNLSSLFKSTDDKNMLSLFGKTIPKEFDTLYKYMSLLDNNMKNPNYDNCELFVKYCSFTISNYSQFVINMLKSNFDNICLIEERYDLEHMNLGNGYYTSDDLDEIISVFDKLEKASNKKDYSLSSIKYDSDNGYLYFSNEVELKFINTIEAFTNLINDQVKDNYASAKENIFYRGHCQTGFLLNPSINRNGYISSERDIYENILLKNTDDFHNCRSHLEILVKMQHYGVPTRLLDVTQNVLVALYMTVEIDTSNKNDNYDGEIIVFYTDEVKYARSDSITVKCSLPALKPSYYVLLSIKVINQIIECFKEDFSVSDILDKSYDVILDKDDKYVNYLIHEIRTEKPSFESKIKANDLFESNIVIPHRDNLRITRQDGAFIVCSLNRILNNDLNNLRFVNSNGKRTIFIISKEQKSSFRKTLEEYGINYAYLFPEIENVAKYIRNKYRSSDYRNLDKYVDKNFK